MRKTLLLIPLVLMASVLSRSVFALENDEITPYKFTDRDNIPFYKIPAASRFIAKRPGANKPSIIYYLTKPKNSHYPIVIVCGGSSSKEDVGSIIHIHRYLLKEFLELGVGVLTVEQWGVDGNKVNKKIFMEHYTRSQRLQDHQAIIEHLKSHPPQGWNGKLIFLGVSEGGPIVTTLTTEYPDITLATINWSGAGDWSWREELWAFLEPIRVESAKSSELINLKDNTSLEEITSRKQFDARMDATLHNPTSNKYFLGMTYKYHADALLYPDTDYKKIRTPFLVVSGVKDTFIQSSDAFVYKAKNAGVNITYIRVEDMDHYVRKRPDIIAKSFKWLGKRIH